MPKARTLSLVVALLAAGCTESRHAPSTSTPTEPGPIAALPAPSAPPPAAPTATSAAPAADAPAIVSFFVTPSPAGLDPVVEAIAGARASIRMILFHLTDPGVVEALAAAKARGVDVQIILDGKNLEERKTAEIARSLTARGVAVTASSRAFSLTHVKAMVIDGTRALVMSLNLTRRYEKTRDYAVVTDDPGVVTEFLAVFDADLKNAAAGTRSTPALSSRALMWSPINSESRIVALADTARASIIASSENLGDTEIQDALVRAESRGVKVRVLAPLCDLNANPFFDVPFVRTLDAAGVDARMMPGPSSARRPYIHAKMMVVDGRVAYLGSVNFSENSTRHARELGIVFSDHAAIGAMTAAFEADWVWARRPPAKLEGVCGER